MLAGVVDEQVPEVGAAGREDQLVSLVRLGFCCQGHVCQQIVLKIKSINQM